MKVQKTNERYNCTCLSCTGEGPAVEPPPGYFDENSVYYEAPLPGQDGPLQPLVLRVEDGAFYQLSNVAHDDPDYLAWLKLGLKYRADSKDEVQEPSVFKYTWKSKEWWLAEPGERERITARNKEKRMVPFASLPDRVIYFAIEAIVDGGATYRDIETEFGIPKSTAGRLAKHFRTHRLVPPA